MRTATDGDTDCSVAKEKAAGDRRLFRIGCGGRI
jgi:hypothetical protein